MKNPLEIEHARMGMCAELLELGRPLLLVGRAAFGAMLYGAAQSGAAAQTAMHAHLLLWLSFIAWAVLEWLGARVVLDRRLFQLFANGTYSVSDLDRLLDRPGKDIANRTRGALSLLRRMGVLATLLCVLLLVHIVAR